MKKTISILFIIIVSCNSYGQIKREGHAVYFDSDSSYSYYAAPQRLSLYTDTLPIFLLRDNETSKFKVEDGGFLAPFSTSIKNPFESHLDFHPYDFLCIYDSATIKQIWNLK